MEIILHIGWHKTGSTSLQVFLLKNRKALIQQQRTYYPSEGLLSCAHHTVAWTFQGRETSPWGPVPKLEGGGDVYIRNAIDSARSRGCNRIIFSSEEFCTFDVDSIRNLYNSLRPLASSVQVVAYVRRQDLLVESAYNMEVKWWGARLTAEFDEYVKNKGAHPNYYRALKGWATVFGADSLTVRCYQRIALVGKDIRVDFCDAVGLSREGLSHMDEDVNDSLGPKTLEFLRVLNNIDLARAEHERISGRLQTYDAEMQSPKAILFRLEDRRSYMAAFERSNGRLGEFGVAAESLMVSDDEGTGRNVSRLTWLEFNDLYDYVGRGQ